MLGDAPILDHVARGQQHVIGVGGERQAPGQNPARIDILEGDHLGP